MTDTFGPGIVALLAVPVVLGLALIGLLLLDRLSTRQGRHHGPAQLAPPAAGPPAPSGPSGWRRPTPRPIPPLAPRLQEAHPVTELPDLPETPEAPTLYYRLTRDGTDSSAFAEVSHRLYDRIFGPRGSDPLLQGDQALLPYFRTSTGDLIDRDHVERHMTHFLMQALGGPKTYTGRAMEVAHRPGRTGHAPTMPITDEAFDRTIGHLATILTDLGVPPAWIGEVADTAETLRPAVVQTAVAGPRLVD